MQYMPVEQPARGSISPLELKRKRDETVGTNLVDRTRQMGPTPPYQYAGNVNTQVFPMGIYEDPLAMPGVGASIPPTVPMSRPVPIAQSAAEPSTEQMMIYGYPYYFDQ
jgi:hypothetical protein